MAVSLRANPRPSYSLLDLPAEVRSVIYEHLLHSDEPSKVCIEWEISTNKLWSYVVVGLSKAGQERWRPIINRVQNATALMRTCSTLWSEVAPYLYDSTIFEFKAFNTLKLFSNRLTPRCNLLVQNIELRRELVNINSYNHHSERLVECIAAFPGLRRLALWRNYLEADTTVNGSPWRSHSVKAMRAVQYSSPQLSRTYFNQLRWGQDLWNVMVIFKTSAEGPEPGEIEFNVEEEHGKILVARREQEVMYEEDAMEGWELAREIAARHDHDSEDDDMKID